MERPSLNTPTIQSCRAIRISPQAAHFPGSSDSAIDMKSKSFLKCLRYHPIPCLGLACNCQGNFYITLALEVHRESSLSSTIWQWSLARKKSWLLFLYHSATHHCHWRCNKSGRHTRMNPPTKRLTLVVWLNSITTLSVGSSKMPNEI